MLARDGGQVWALRLEGKTDQEKFKELGWGLPREIRESDSETYFTGDFAHGISGILTNVYPALPRRFGKSYWGEIFTPPAQLNQILFLFNRGETTLFLLFNWGM